ncbi:MAG: hypothetical protein LQ342_000396 [Letrouitia transgressa]|nr:MAG: hypothetical protein LQ342_000396 [Letrouitia transgressa]
MCQYDLTETERQPILQAEALKEKDKAIARLSHELQILRSQPRIKAEPRDDDLAAQSPRGIRLSPIALAQSTNGPQRRSRSGSLGDSIYFGTPDMKNVADEFANLSVNGLPANLTHLIPREFNSLALQTQPSNPFPTFWRSSEGITTLLNLLPKDQEDIFSYLSAFQRRAQACSFPHIPDECTELEVQRFLSNRKQNAEQHPDMLALLFATLAQGLQNGVYDKFGGDWHAGAVVSESRLGDAFIAASMQCLRLASFWNQPKFLIVQTLVMMGPYLTNSGRFLDAWTLFGITIRIAQSIGLHRDPGRLNPPVPVKEANARRNLWWWILHLDQEYSSTLGRPLGISSMGDCPPPEPLVWNAATSLSNYISQFTILARQILSAGYLNASRIDHFTDQLLTLKATLPDSVQFDETWLNPEKVGPGWPLDVQAATLHAKIHNYVVLLNRQRDDETPRTASNQTHESTGIGSDNHPFQESVGRQRVLQSCRAILQAFEFFHTRLRAGLICWTMGQQSFNAAMLLVLSMLETRQSTDLDVVQRAYSTFLEMNKLGIHRLAEAAVERIGSLMKDVPSGQMGKEKVMDHQGMILLEDPGLQGCLGNSFSPLSFKMAGSVLRDEPTKKRRTTTGSKEREVSDHKLPQAAPRSSKATTQRTSHGVRVKPRPLSTGMPAHRTSRPSMRRRPSPPHSPNVTHSQNSIHVPPDVTQWPLDPSSLSAPPTSQQQQVTSPSVLSTNQQNFGNFARGYELQNQIIPQNHSFHTISRPSTTASQPGSGFHNLHHTGSDSSIQFTSQLSPTDLTPTEVSPSEVVNNGFQSSPHLDFSGYGHFHTSPIHQTTSLHTPPFSTNFTNQGIPCSYAGQF